MNKCSCKQGCSCKAGCNCTGCRCNKYAGYFDTFANANRMKIIDCLMSGSKNVSQIMRDTGIEQTYVSHSLKRLEENEIVVSSKDGKFKIYSLNKKKITPMLKALQSIDEN